VRSAAQEPRLFCDFARGWQSKFAPSNANQPEKEQQQQEKEQQQQEKEQQ
jgi:hypothetical protein